MVYINSRGELVDETAPTPINFFWKIINFIVLFFKTLLGLEDVNDRKKNDDIGRSRPLSGGFGGGGGGGSGGRKPGDGTGPRGFGPRGFKSITDLPSAPPATSCAGGMCG